MKQLITRMPEKLHKKLKMEALKKSVTLNSLVIDILQSDFKKSKNAECLEIEGYKE